MARFSADINCITNLSNAMRKQTFCIGEKEGADQLRSNYKADHIFVCATRIVQFLYFLNPKFQASIDIFGACTGQFASDLLGGHNVSFLRMWLISTQGNAKQIVSEQTNQKTLNNYSNIHVRKAN